MQIGKNILILGPAGSGKTTRLKELKLLYPTFLVLDEAVTVDQVRWFYDAAVIEGTHCIIVSQLGVKEFPFALLEQFQIYRCEYKPLATQSSPETIDPVDTIINRMVSDMPFHFYEEYRSYIATAMRAIAMKASRMQRDICADHAKVTKLVSRSGRPRWTIATVDKSSIRNAPSPEFLSFPYVEAYR